MKAKVYQIEYQSNAFSTEYSTELSEARVRLEFSGFVQMSKLEDNKKINLNEEYWECPEDSVFNLLKAKIVEIECINHFVDHVYRLKSAMGAVEMMTPSQIENSFNPEGVPLPGVEVENDYNREQTKYIMEDYIVIVAHEHVTVKLKTIH